MDTHLYQQVTDAVCAPKLYELQFVKYPMGVPCKLPDAGEGGCLVPTGRHRMWAVPVAFVQFWDMGPWLC